MKHQSGVTLVEVLVSMVIMALGMVSLAALQNFTLRYQLGSVHRAQLSGLLSDYAERVRSNLAQAPGQLAGAPDASPYFFGQTWSAQSAEPVAASGAPNCTGNTSCTAAQLAAADMVEWRARVRRELPRGSVQVVGDAVQGMTVSFMWIDKELGSSSLSACPAGAQAPDGVRCATFSIIP